MKKARMKRKQRRKLIWMVAGLVVLLYLGLAVYFHNHFFPKTTLNGRKAGGYTAQKVMDEITEEIHSYQLKIATRDKHTEKNFRTGYFAGTTVGRRNNRAGTRTEYFCMAGKNFPETDIEKYNTCRL